MAKSIIPSPMDRRHLIEKDLDETRCLAIADAYVDDGRASEAVAFLQKAGAEERLDVLAQEAVESGDAFLFKAVVDAQQRDPGAERWLALAAAAEAAGKPRYASMARRHARSSES